MYEKKRKSQNLEPTKGEGKPGLTRKKEVWRNQLPCITIFELLFKFIHNPTYSQLDIHKTYQFSDSKILYSFILDNEELKVATPSKTNRYENKFENYKERAYVTPKMMGIEKPGPVPDPWPNKWFKFCLGEKNNKLLNRVVKNTDYLDLYTSKVNGTNSRVNANLQSKRAGGYQSIGLVSPINNVSKAPQNLLLQKYGRDSLLRIPLQNHP